MVQLIRTVCDRHWNLKQRADQPVDAASTQSLRFGKKEVEFDLCVECIDELSALLEPWFEAGRRPGRPSIATAVPVPPKAAPPTAGSNKKQESDPDGEYHCRWPEGCDDTRGNAQGRSMHERKAHNFFWSQLSPEEQEDVMQKLHARLALAS